MPGKFLASAFDLLFAEIGERGHYRLIRHVSARPAGAIVEREFEPELGEEGVEHFTAQRTDRMEPIARAVVFEQDRRQRLRRRAVQYPGAGRGIVFAVLGAAVYSVGPRNL